MIGEFHYCSSSSEDSDSDCESDLFNSEDGLEKLVSEKKQLQDKIQNYEQKLMYIQKTLKSLNEERKNLLELRNKLIMTACFENEGQIDEASIGDHSANVSSVSSANNTSYVESLTTATQGTNSAPLNLHVPEFVNCDDIEEFDSEEEL